MGKKYNIINKKEREEKEEIKKEEVKKVVENKVNIISKSEIQDSLIR